MNRVTDWIANTRAEWHRPSYMPRSIWYRDKVGGVADEVGGWVLCNVLGRHRVRFGTAPRCYRCGRVPGAGRGRARR